MSRIYKQIRLASGEEIICEVVDWPEEDDEEAESIIIRNAFMIVSAEDWQSSTRYYTFRPFMMYQERSDQLIGLNINHITSMANPHDFIISQWKNHLQQMREIPKTTLEEMMDTLPDSDKDKIVSLKPRYH
jgi:hypothetical protein